MRFICLGYADMSYFETAPEAEVNRFVESCFEYDDELRRGGHFVAGQALMPPSFAVTLRPQNGQVVTCDGPFAETKEQLGGILILEARDMNHAIQLMSRHPGAKFGPFEIRPENEGMTRMIAERSAALA